MHGDDNIHCTTRVQSVESLVIHGVANIVACLSKATRLHLLYLLASLVLHAVDDKQKQNILYFM